MAVQVRSDNNNQPFVLHGQAYVQTKTLATIGGRSTVLKPFTVMAEIASSKKITPFVSLTTTTGASYPCYIYVGEEIAAATIAAGDVTDLPVIFGGNVIVDEDQVIFDAGTLTADSVVNAAAANPYIVMTARKALEAHGIILKGTDDISTYEN